MFSRGVSAPGTAFWGIAVGVILFMALMLKSGEFPFSGSRTIRVSHQPKLYWLMIAVLALVAVLLLVLGWLMVTHLPYISHL
jgi:hypothetical protein